MIDFNTDHPSAPQGLPRTEAGFQSPPLPHERNMSYLKPEHQGRVADAYHAFKDVEGFAKVASLADIRVNDGNLSIPLYVRGKTINEEKGEYAPME